MTDMFYLDLALAYAWLGSHVLALNSFKVVCFLLSSTLLYIGIGRRRGTGLTLNRVM